MKLLIFLGVIPLLFCTTIQATELDEARPFSSEKDFISLHYDHAPDKDDGQSAAADRTILETLYDKDWIRKHVIAVSGAYGKNASAFNSKSDAVMDAAWNEYGGWLAAHTDKEKVINELAERWIQILKAGGAIWVKEGGQSDITAAVVECIKKQLPELDTNTRIHVVQHSDWNENQTTDAALAYTRKHTDYIRIRDANNYLNIKGGNRNYEKVAKAHPRFGQVWKAAFTYYNPRQRLDFSDTGELMHILGLEEMSIEDFREQFLDNPGVNDDK